MRKPQHPHNRCVLFPLAAVLAVSALGSGRAAAQTITEIIDATGDGEGNGLVGASDIAVDGVGNVYVAGDGTDNAFRITPAGVITEIATVRATARATESSTARAIAFFTLGRQA